MDQETQIDVPQVMGIAATVSAVGRELAGGAGFIVRSGPSGQGALHGSVLCADLPRICGTFQQVLAQLGRQVAQFGADIHRSAVDYQHTDQVTRARLIDAGGPGAH